jgi:outer membrane protein OmpA-like peptidoglycan-associated protein
MRDPASRTHRVLLLPVLMAAASLCAPLATVRADPPPTPTGSLADRLKGVQNADNPLPDWKPMSAAAVTASREIVLAPGLTVVTAVNQGGVGDYESIKQIDRVDSKTVHLLYDATISAAATKTPDNLAASDTDPATANKPPIKVHCGRLIDDPDLQAAHAYSEDFCGNEPEHKPGTTAISISTEVLTQLREGKDVQFQYRLFNMMQAFAHLGKILTGPGALAFDPKRDLQNMQMIGCGLHRVEATDFAMPVLLNDQPAELPALHATCENTMGKADFYILDHPGNPIMLAWQGDALGGRLQVIKIQEASVESIRQVNAAAAAAAAGQAHNAMEQRLAQCQSVDVYGIYFDFNSASVKPESDVVLKKIDGVLGAHPDWKLSIAGHTDNIGGDAFNLDLSKRRAAAVKAALVSSYGIGADRLTTTGFGASRPVASNDTLEGRARNRRVELQRPCK